MVIFLIYDAPTGGKALWSEKQEVTTSNGLFAVVLGSLEIFPDDVFVNSGRYLGIQVDPDPELTPRQRLTSVPYAINGGGWIDDSSSVYLTNTSANVELGTSTPVTRLDVAGGNWNVMGSEGDVHIGDLSYRLKIGVATAGDGAAIVDCMRLVVSRRSLWGLTAVSG